jgi:hypothetical protein
MPTARAAVLAARQMLRQRPDRGVWALLVGAGALLVPGLTGWPTASDAVRGIPAGVWLLLMLVGCAAALIGAYCLGLLLAAYPGRRVAAAGVSAAAAGTALVLPVSAAMALIGPRPAPAMTVLWCLGAGGLVLLGSGWLALGSAVVVSRAFNATDGALILGSVGTAAVAFGSGWRLPLVLASIGVLAAGLGLGWSAARWQWRSDRQV